MNFEFLFKPVEELDSLITGLFDGAPLLVALGIAFLLGLRHASDPDHLVAVTSLVAAEDGDTRKAARLGAWWGVGHAGALVAIGIPLIAFKTELPAWLESGAEKAIGVVILVLAARVIYKWARGDYRANAHAHDGGHASGATCAEAGPPARQGAHARPGALDRAAARAGRHRRGRAAADRGAAEPARGRSGAGGVRADVDRVDGRLHRRLRVGADATDGRAPLPHVLIPGLGAFGMVFGIWYAGLG